MTADRNQPGWKIASRLLSTTKSAAQMELVMSYYKASLALVILTVNIWRFGSRLINVRSSWSTSSIQLEADLGLQYTLGILHPRPISVDGTILPTAHFSWPNGQGTDKFFNGRNAAARWRACLGPIYRIWSGFTPEM